MSFDRIAEIWLQSYVSPLKSLILLLCMSETQTCCWEYHIVLHSSCKSSKKTITYNVEGFNNKLILVYKCSSLCSPSSSSTNFSKGPARPTIFGNTEIRQLALKACPLEDLQRIITSRRPTPLRLRLSLTADRRRHRRSAITDTQPSIHPSNIAPEWLFHRKRRSLPVIVQSTTDSTSDWLTISLHRHLV